MRDLPNGSGFCLVVSLAAALATSACSSSTSGPDAGASPADATGDWAADASSDSADDREPFDAATAPDTSMEDSAKVDASVDVDPPRADATPLDAPPSDAMTDSPAPPSDAMTDSPAPPSDAAPGALRVVWAKVVPCGSSQPSYLASMTDDGFVYAGTCAPLQLPELPPTPGNAGRAALIRFDAQGRAAWARQYGSQLEGGDITALATDGKDGIAIGGSFVGTIDFGGGPLRNPEASTDLFVARIDAAGDQVWSRSFGSLGNELVGSVAFFGSGEIILAGQHDFRGAGTRFGNFQLASTTGCGQTRYIAKLDALGEPSFAQCFGDVVRASADGQGNVFVAEGTQLARIASPSGPRVWALPIAPFTLRQDEILAVANDATGNFVATGRVGGVSTHQGDMPRYDGFQLYVAKVRPDGQVISLHRIASTGDPDTFRGAEIRGQGLALGPEGDAWIGGLFAGTVDLGGGAFTGGLSFHDDGFVVHFGPDGKFLHSFQLDAAVDAITRTSNGDVVIAGHFLGTMHIGPFTLKSPETYATNFVARLAP